MWFGTEAGLAKFDGRRTQTINDPALPTGRVLALQSDQDGSLWIGTEAGATRYTANGFEALKETGGQTISAIIAPEPRHTFISSEQGQVFEATVKTVTETAGSSDILSRNEKPTAVTRDVINTRQLLSTALQSTDHDHPGPLAITSLAFTGNHLFVGTLGRGVIRIDDGNPKETQMRPLAYFVNALLNDSNGDLWVGSRSKKEEAGVLVGKEPSQLSCRRYNRSSRRVVINWRRDVDWNRQQMSLSFPSSELNA